MAGALFSIAAVLVALVVGWVAVAAAGGDPVVTDSDDHGDQGDPPWLAGGSGQGQRGQQNGGEA